MSHPLCDFLKQSEYDISWLGGIRKKKRNYTLGRRWLGTVCFWIQNSLVHVAVSVDGRRGRCRDVTKNETTGASIVDHKNFLGVKKYGQYKLNRFFELEFFWTKIMKILENLRKLYIRFPI